LGLSASCCAARELQRRGSAASSRIEADDPPDHLGNWGLYIDGLNMNGAAARELEKQLVRCCLGDPVDAFEVNHQIPSAVQDTSHC
jgi:hypothetical protein